MTPPSALPSAFVLSILGDSVVKQTLQHSATCGSVPDFTDLTHKQAVFSCESVRELSKRIESVAHSNDRNFKDWNMLYIVPKKRDALLLSFCSPCQCCSNPLAFQAGDSLQKSLLGNRGFLSTLARPNFKILLDDSKLSLLWKLEVCKNDTLHIVAVDPFTVFTGHASLLYATQQWQLKNADDVIAVRLAHSDGPYRSLKLSHFKVMISTLAPYIAITSSWKTCSRVKCKRRFRVLEIPPDKYVIQANKRKRAAGDTNLCSAPTTCEVCYLESHKQKKKKTLPLTTQTKKHKVVTSEISETTPALPGIDCETVSHHSRTHLSIPYSSQELPPDVLLFLRDAIKACTDNDLLQPAFHSNRRFGPHAGKSCGRRMLQAIMFGTVKFETTDDPGYWQRTAQGLCDRLSR
jgi:hypothetical protein